MMPEVLNDDQISHLLRNCPVCRAQIDLGTEPSIGLRVVCSACQSELEVIWLFPVELAVCEKRPDQIHGHSIKDIP